jgi:glycogen operon protein
MKAYSSLGSNWIEKEDGVHFSIFSAHAEKIELLLYSNNNELKEVIEVKNKRGDIWYTFVSGIKPKQLYAYRVYGKYDPNKGFRFNPNKVLIDPYAKAIAGEVIYNDAIFGYNRDDPNLDLSFNEKDSSPFIPKCVVIDSHFEWEDDNFIPPQKEDLIIYEVHVKGLTKLREDIDKGIRGTFAALATDKVINYFKDLGINAIELMPIHYFIDERILVEKGLKNYWGYNPINFFSPTCRYSSSGFLGEQVIEFKRMVNELHNAGIAVILDVVFNHTGEEDHLGPTICFRGIDNISYYLLDPNNPRFYLNYTGTGNTLNLNHPIVIQMVIDSLRYWIQEMHVDGFRFDLATTFMREYDKINPSSNLITAIKNDPVISKAILIAEPWDLGPQGYQLGNFPPNWLEWNNKFRNTVRRFWLREPVTYEEIANRIMGSIDLFKNKEFPASINYVTSHDGFTLEDLVSYNEKHNENNLLGNKDGEEENFSWNCGYEGPTNNTSILNLRERLKRNLIITLMVSQGVPMILGGDEISRTQKGNNNAFCQDNEISWFNWNLDERKERFLEFFKEAIKFRKESKISKNGHYIWLTQNGNIVDEKIWKTLTNFIAFIIKDYLIIFNASNENVKFLFPEGKWKLILSSYTKEIKIVENEDLIEPKSCLIYKKI